MNRNVVGLDIAKQVFHLFTMQDGKAVKKKLKRSELSAFVAQLPAGLMAMEACGGAHHWARLLMAKGFKVKIIPPQFVTPYFKSNKNDAKDAAACVRQTNFCAESALKPVSRRKYPKHRALVHVMSPRFLSTRVFQQNHLRAS